jgi:pSer/pThr/pTyr-binding forkhead associated (FHA) protein
MPTKITLKVIQGKLAKKEFTFSKYTTCILGRSDDCGIQFPKEELKISRRHCRLYINPPDIRIRDLGSKTGTYVNDQNIGQRDKNHSTHDGAKLDFPEHNLKDGDEIKLAKTVFMVEIEQNDPFLQILKRLLGLADRGAKDLASI